MSSLSTIKGSKNPVQARRPRKGFALAIDCKVLQSRSFRGMLVSVAGLRVVPANAIASYSINIDTDVRAHTKTSLSVRRRLASPA